MIGKLAVRLLIAIVVLFSCSFAGYEVYVHFKEAKIIKVYTANAPVSLMPLSAGDDSEWEMVDLMFDRLLAVDSNAVFIPQIAESYTIEDGGRVCTIVISKKALWQDGTHITPEDIEWTWLASSNPEFTKIIDNALARSITGFKKIDNRVFKFISAKPIANWGIVLYNFVPVHSRSESKIVPGRRVNNIIGSGPYKLVRSNNKETELLHWTGYQNNHDGLAKGFRFNHVAAVKDAAQLVKDGGAHIIITNRVRATLIEKGVYGPTVQAHTAQSADLEAVWFNCSGTVTSDKNVRQALAQLVPWQQISVDMNLYPINLTTTFWPDIIVRDVKTPPISGKPNVELAKQLLDQGGWAYATPEATYRSKGNTPLKVTVLYEPRKDVYNIFARFVENAKIAGIELQFKETPVPQLMDSMQNGRGDAWVMTWIFSIDPVVDTVLFTSTGIPTGGNFCHFSTPTIDKLADEAMVEQDNSKRMALYRTISDQLVDEAPIVPLTRQTVSYITSYKIDGFATDKFGRIHGFMPGSRAWALR